MTRFRLRNGRLLAIVLIAAGVITISAKLYEQYLNYKATVMEKEWNQRYMSLGGLKVERVEEALPFAKVISRREMKDAFACGLGVGHFNEVVVQDSRGYEVCLWFLDGVLRRVKNSDYQTWQWQIPTDFRGLYLTVWITTAAICVFLMVLWLRKPRYAQGCCRQCGYDLRGSTSGICSECGRTFAIPGNDNLVQATLRLPRVAMNQVKDR